MGLNNSHMGLNHSLQGLFIPQMGLMMLNFYFPRQWSGDSQQRCGVFSTAAHTTNCCLKALLKAFHSTRLTPSSKAVTYEESTF
jgi:hypothetical protein